MYGLPPAGLLALELLQQSRLTTPSTPDFPRSEIIQNLSVLVSTIDCVVRPTSGNYDICNQAKKMLQTILDTVLSADRHLPQQQQDPDSQLQDTSQSAMASQ